MSDATPNDDQSPPSNPNPPSPADGSSDGVDVIGEDARVSRFDAPPAPAAPRAEGSNAGEAIFAAQIANFILARRFGQPMTAEEHAQLVADLEPVLRKHNVPSLLPPEEAKLVSTVAEIVLPRILSAGADTDDRSVSGQEGLGEVNRAPAGGAPRSRVGLNIAGVARP